jgi:murein DD-endopeptidase MepM/ murein hydrolase activator NlpD
MSELLPAEQPESRPRLPAAAIIAVALVAVVVLGGGALVVRRLAAPRHPCGPAMPCADSSFCGTDSLQRNEVLATVLGRWCLPTEQVSQVYSALGRSGFDFRAMRPGDIVQLQYRGLELRRIVYQKDLVTSYTVELDSAGANATKLMKPVDTLRAVIRGTIEGSLWNSLVGMGESPSLVVEFANILGYEVDFLTECNPGDTFEILLDRYYVESLPYGDGRVLAVHYRGPVGDLYGYYFRSPGGHWDYYNSKGQSLRKTVLRSPLNYARVTSFFGNRLHPITRRYRQHQGVDYGAPSGTPVSAIADGTVQRASWNGGYGNFVQVRHSGGLVSCYGHLSRYGPGVKAGRGVRQGQTIGYVGSTGFSTGPHLHFEIRRDGSPVNPLKVIPPRAEPVARKLMPDFERAKSEYAALLKLPAGPIRPQPPDTAAAR